MGQRRDRLNKRLRNQIATRRDNSLVKLKERDRRDATMLALVKAHRLPYTPAIMSWLSAKLDKKASQIVEADIKKLLA